MTPTKTSNGKVDILPIERKVEELEAKLIYSDWLREEQHQQIIKLATAMAGMLAQQARPAIEQGILEQLLNTPTTSFMG
jgi:hypothetical protein